PGPAGLGLSRSSPRASWAGIVPFQPQGQLGWDCPVPAPGPAGLGLSRSSPRASWAGIVPFHPGRREQLRRALQDQGR
ncbi:unnamed protein product, partial [Coccothraustes coccothraustes]